MGAGADRQADRAEGAEVKPLLIALGVVALCWLVAAGLRSWALSRNPFDTEDRIE
jgi:hypothetical protein